MTPELTPAELLRVILKKAVALLFVGCGGFRLYRRLAKPSVTIILYHRIIEDSFKGVVPSIATLLHALEEQLEFFREHYRIISMDEAIARLKGGRVDRQYLVITFDDGYRDLLTLGVPLFRKLRIRPMAFLVTACLDLGSPLLPDVIRTLIYGYSGSAMIALGKKKLLITEKARTRIRAVRSSIARMKSLDIPGRQKFFHYLETVTGGAHPHERLMLSWSEAAELAAAEVALGSHSVNHVVLSRVDAQTAEEEIIRSKEAIEARCGQKVWVFAYPNGKRADFTYETAQMLRKAGYTAAVTSEPGHNRVGDNLFFLKRTPIQVTDSLADIKLRLALEELR